MYKIVTLLSMCVCSYTDVAYTDVVPFHTWGLSGYGFSYEETV